MRSSSGSESRRLGLYVPLGLSEQRVNPVVTGWPGGPEVEDRLSDASRCADVAAGLFRLLPGLAAM